MRSELRSGRPGGTGEGGVEMEEKHKTRRWYAIIFDRIRCCCSGRGNNVEVAGAGSRAGVYSCRGISAEQMTLTTTTHKGVCRVIRTTPRDKPNSSGVTRDRVIVAEFYEDDGPDAAEQYIKWRQSIAHV